MKPPAWVAPYIGIPYAPGGRVREGLDCWGLFALVQRERFAFDISEYDGPLWTGRRDAEALGKAAAQFANRFTSITPGEEWAGDAIVLRLFGHPIHIGLVICPGAMLHIEEACDSIVEDYRGLKWRDRIAGFHRAELKGAS